MWGNSQATSPHSFRTPQLHGRSIQAYQSHCTRDSSAQSLKRKAAAKQRLPRYPTSPSAAPMPLAILLHLLADRRACAQSQDTASMSFSAPDIRFALGIDSHDLRPTAQKHSAHCTRCIPHPGTYASLCPAWSRRSRGGAPWGKRPSIPGVLCNGSRDWR